MARSSTLVAAALTASGCDPGWNVSGHVIDSLGAPVGGAMLTLVYPSGRTEKELADPAGGIHLGGVGSAFEVPKASVKIEKPGYRTRSVRTLDLCYRSTEAGNLAIACGSGEGTIILSKEPTYVAPVAGESAAGDAAPGASATSSTECSRDADCGLTSWTKECCTRCRPFAMTAVAAASRDAFCNGSGTSAGPPRCPALHCPKPPDSTAKCVAGRCELSP